MFIVFIIIYNVHILDATAQMSVRDWLWKDVKRKGGIFNCTFFYWPVQAITVSSLKREV